MVHAIVGSRRGTFRGLTVALLAVGACTAGVKGGGAGGSGGPTGTPGDAAADGSGSDALGGGAGGPGGGGGASDAGGDATVRPGPTPIPPTLPPMTCDEAKAAPGSAGCTFFPVAAVVADAIKEVRADGLDCLVVFAVNPGTQPIKLQLFDGATAVPLGQVARLPRGSGSALIYAPFDAALGIPPGDVALLFLWDGITNGKRGCPEGITPAARGPRPGGPGSGIGNAFRLSAERPVVAYQMHPYNAATSFYTSATLLLPTEAWGKDHFVAAPSEALAWGSFAIAVASEADTTVSFRPRAATVAGGTVPAAAAGTVVSVKLGAGQFVRFSTAVLREFASLAGSALAADKPVGVFGGSHCFFEPGAVAGGTSLAGPGSTCDGAHQQVPPVSALGHEYAAVGYRERFPTDNHLWQIMGAVDGTQLSYQPYRPDGAPTTLNAGQVVKFAPLGYPRPRGVTRPSQPFIVRSQDAKHPFHFSALMTTAFAGLWEGHDKYVPPPMPPTDAGAGSGSGSAGATATTLCDECSGDPDIVNVVPLQQFMPEYTFFTDPSYPDTSLTVVRRKNPMGQFGEVRLDCAGGLLAGWKPLGDLEYTHVDLVSAYFQKPIPGCDNGRQHMVSSAPFAVTVWGVGRFKKGAAPPPGQMREGSGHTSYGYPAGSAIGRINDVPPIIVQ